MTALITVTSVMNGFERSLQQSILDFMPQAVITTGNGVLDPQAHRSHNSPGCVMW